LAEIVDQETRLPAMIAALEDSLPWLQKLENMGPTGWGRIENLVEDIKALLEIADE
jgi:hypothetical protein